MDYLESIEATQRERKDLAKFYMADEQLAFVVKQNKQNPIRRTLWNLIFWYVDHRPHSVLADMMFVSYRMGLEDATFEPDGM